MTEQLRRGQQSWARREAPGTAGQGHPVGMLAIPLSVGPSRGSEQRGCTIRPESIWKATLAAVRRTGWGGGAAGAVAERRDRKNNPGASATHVGRKRQPILGDSGLRGLSQWTSEAGRSMLGGCIAAPRPDAGSTPWPPVVTIGTVSSAATEKNLNTYTCVWIRVTGPRCCVPGTTQTALQ